jgi:hypothetical protein
VQLRVQASPGCPTMASIMYLLIHELCPGKDDTKNKYGEEEVLVRVSCACGKAQASTSSSPGCPNL